MSYRKNGNNKAYENLKANPDVKKHMLEACIMADKEDSLVRNADGLGIRRIEKMKKNKYGDILKKALVASFSIIATGAIMYGVASYNNGGKNSNNKFVVLKDTTIKESQKDTVVNETETKETYVTEKLHSDELAYTIRVNERNSVDGYISVGDKVDFLFIPRDIDDIRDYINGTGKYKNTEKNEGKKNSKLRKRNKDGKLLYGPNQDMILDDILSVFDAEVIRDIEILAISTHFDTTGEYNDVTLRLKKGDEKEIKKLDAMFGLEDCALLLHNSENVTDKKFLSSKLKDGEVAFTIKASERQGVDGYEEVGDTIDFLCMPGGVDDLRDYINGVGKYKDSRKNDSNIDRELMKREKDVETLFGPNQDMTLEEVYEYLDVKRYDNIEILAVSNHAIGTEMYSNITLKLTEEQAKEIYKLISYFGEDSYTMAMNTKKTK